jgi:TnpA family transposase
MASKHPELLSPEQREEFLGIPADLTDREVARYYTLNDRELTAVNQHRRPQNRLGFAVQLCLLRCPGRTITEVKEIPEEIIAYIASQLNVSPDVFADYGKRVSTIYEHLDEIRQEFGYRDCTWRELLQAARALMPTAMESERSMPLIEAALDFMRNQKIFAPPMTTVERLVWAVQREAEKRVFKLLTGPLTRDHKALLDSLLRTESKRDKTRLAWLREAPEFPSAKSLRIVLDRLAYAQRLKLPTLTQRLHRTRILQLARRCSRYQAQPLAKLKPDARYSLLVAYLSELTQDLIDQALDMFDKMLGDLLRKGERKQETHLQDNAKPLNYSLTVLTKMAKAFLKADAEELDFRKTVYAEVDKPTLVTTVTSAEELARPADLDYLDLIEGKYVQMRGAMLAMYELLQFRAVRSTDPSTDALDHVTQLTKRKERVTAVRQAVGKKLSYAPMAHVTDRWRKHVTDGQIINPNYYEASAFEALKGRLRAGDVYVEGSRRYRNFDSYLLRKDSWISRRDRNETRLAITGDAYSYLQARDEQIREKFAEVHAKFERGELPGVYKDDAGHLHLVALGKDVSDEAVQAKRKVYNTLPRIHLADMLVELDSWTGFLNQFTHLSFNEPPEGEARMKLLAAMMALGMNLGLGKMAESTKYTYRQLSWSVDWHIREDTILKAQAVLTNFVLRRAFSKYWGDGTKSSSDGMRIKVGVRAANAVRNKAHFGTDRGVTVYTHVGDIGLPFGQKVISTNDREALYVIDALCNHETDLNIQEHYTDTHGYTEHVFALCSLLGFRFAPRIASLMEQRLFSLGQPGDYGAFNSLIKGRISIRPILENWDEILRLAASIKNGTVSASLIMRKLAAYPRQNTLAKALAELGKIEKTLFVLEYISDPAMRRRVLRGLNKGESVNSVSRGIFFGRQGELRERAHEDQMHRTSCLKLLVAAIAAWNTVYLEGAIAAMQEAGEEIPEHYFPHIGNHGWEHINLLGRYNFDPREARSLTSLRPLRSHSEIEESEGEL